MSAAPQKRPKLALVRTALPQAEASAARDSVPKRSDEELVREALGGSGSAKKQLYVRHVEYIAGMTTRLLRSVEASEDVVQDSFLIAFSKLDTLREPAAFRGWLASIAVNQVHRRLRRRKWLRLIGLDTGLDTGSLDALAREDVSVEARSELAALDFVLQELPLEKRTAWMLRYVEGEALDAVALACGCSLATVKRWIASADEHVRGRAGISLAGEVP